MREGNRMRQITDTGMALIRRFEGFSAIPYRCPGGYETIGYGHVIYDDEEFSEPITEQEAAKLLRRDVQHAEGAVLRYIAVPLSDGQFDALVSFTFNVGAGALQRSTLRRRVNRQAHARVPAEFMRWVWADGRKLPGLVRRRRSEAALYRG